MDSLLELQEKRVRFVRSMPTANRQTATVANLRVSLDHDDRFLFLQSAMTEMRETIAGRVVDTENEMVRAALIKMGGTPPKPASDLPP